MAQEKLRTLENSSMSPTWRGNSHKFKVIPALCHKKQKNKNFIERDG